LIGIPALTTDRQFEADVKGFKLANHDTPIAPSGAGIRCDIVAHHALCLTSDAFPTVRREPGPGAGTSLPPNFLKHADEQTVAGLSAVLHAVCAFGMAETSFRDWGVIAAPCFLGRTTLASALEQFAVEGPWGLSPHFIPHRSQHALSGTISLALKIHGPNFGAGGGPTGMVESLLAAAALLADESVPGVWVVVTGWDPELIPVQNQTTLPQGSCRAIALALVSHRTGSLNPLLCISGAPQREMSRVEVTKPTLVDFADVLKTLSPEQPDGVKKVWRCADGAWIELRSSRRQSILQPPHSLNRLNANGRRAMHGKGAGTESKR
jgi:hypothetical protein